MPDHGGIDASRYAAFLPTILEWFDRTLEVYSDQKRSVLSFRFSRLAEPLQVAMGNEITCCEINPSTKGINRRGGGIFLKDSGAGLYLAHSGSKSFVINLTNYVRAAEAFKANATGHTPKPIAKRNPTSFLRRSLRGRRRSTSSHPQSRASATTEPLFGRDKTVYVNHYYFYIDDAEFRPLFVKVCSYAPWSIKLCLNGHEWAKRQLDKQCIGYEALDNGFLSCEQPTKFAGDLGFAGARGYWPRLPQMAQPHSATATSARPTGGL